MASASDVLAKAKLAPFSQTVYRNIVSLVVSEDLFDDLTDDPDDYATAQSIEALYTPPFYQSRNPIIDRPFEEAEWFNAVQFPFEHWQESRFSQGKYGVWYGASQLETTVFETAYHWLKRTLLEEGELPVGRELQRKVYTVAVDALLLDIRGLAKTYPALISRSDYSLTQQIGQVVHRQGHPGLVTKSARCSGDVQAIFNPSVLSDPRPVRWLTYQIKAEGITTAYSDGTELLSFSSSDLLRP
jgi:hypothetical protein